MTLPDTTCLLSLETETIIKNYHPSDPTTITQTPSSKRPATSTLQCKSPDTALPSAITDGDADSGYSSQTITAGRDSAVEGESNTSGGTSLPTFFLSKKKRLIDIDVDEATQERFRVVQIYFERLLLEYVRAHQRAGAKYTPMSTRLMMMGTSHSDASPHIVVLCQPENKKLVKRFITDSVIEKLYQSLDPSVPSFQLMVIGIAPQLRHTNSPVEVTIGRPPQNTFCGTPIQFVHPLGRRNATFGGMIKVEMESGERKIYGITAGHAAEEWHNELRPARGDADSHGSDTEHHDLQSAMDELTINETEFQEYSDPEDSDTEMYSLMMGALSNARPDEGEGRWNFTKAWILGPIVAYAGMPTGKGDHDNQCYDWALFGTNIYGMNQLPGNPEAQLVISHRKPGTTGNCSVCVVSGSGFKKGQVSSTPGRILLGSGEIFVDTYMLTIQDDRGICDGDSGSWVVDSRTFEVYGHLVATDIFGSGYVIPLESIFADIKRHLGAKLVTLPDISDISNMQNAPVNIPPDRFPVHSFNNMHTMSIWDDGIDSLPFSGMVTEPFSIKDSSYNSMDTTPTPSSHYFRACDNSSDP